MSLTPLCDALHDIDESVAIFGGGAFNPDLSRNDACVFSSVGGYSERGILVLLVGGEDFRVSTTHVAGWKPLGREFLVTKAENALLFELDGKPAYDAYYRYLNILKDEHFFSNTLEFPFFYRHNGINILRAPIHCNEDGTLVMTSDVDENVKARLAYGDPWTILNSVRKEGQKIGEFKPDIIKIFSCAARRTFWGKEEISNETLPFQSIAPTSGFYTSGEFLRTNGFVNQHNVTLVIAAMREGVGDEHCRFDMALDSFTGQVSMVNRLATFIDAATQELAEANAKLSLMAISDSLSRLFNRGEIQRRINECISRGTPACLVMLDIDNFKQINDTYGHKEGDNVIVGLSGVLKKMAHEMGILGLDSISYDIVIDAESSKEEKKSLLDDIKTSAGRWGGEEFMVLLQEVSLEKALDFAEQVRKAFSAIEFKKAGHRSVSMGVIEIQKGESADSAYVRVDQALYKAKENGRDQVFQA
jgi:GGDEF domain-containing protein